MKKIRLYFVKINGKPDFNCGQISMFKDIKSLDDFYEFGIPKKIKIKDFCYEEFDGSEPKGKRYKLYTIEFVSVKL